jgi:putative pyruvate formate lyase activating enzyme
MGNGETISTLQLAERMLSLQRRGAHNLNLVTPTHWLPQILASLWLAIPRGFHLPVVWNSGGYETVEALRLLDSLVDIYLPDMKYADDGQATALSAAPGYPVTNRDAVREMLRQVGHLEMDEDGIARRGLIIRHLVLPEGRAGSGQILGWIGENLGVETHVALMSQYFPAYCAHDIPGMGRPLDQDEYDDAVEALEAAGLENGWVQELASDRSPV